MELKYNYTVHKTLFCDFQQIIPIGEPIGNHFWKWFSPRQLLLELIFAGINIRGNEIFALN